MHELGARRKEPPLGSSGCSGEVREPIGSTPMPSPGESHPVTGHASVLHLTYEPGPGEGSGETPPSVAADEVVGELVVDLSRAVSEPVESYLDYSATMDRAASLWQKALGLFNQARYGQAMVAARGSAKLINHLLAKVGPDDYLEEQLAGLTMFRSIAHRLRSGVGDEDKGKELFAGALAALRRIGRPSDELRLSFAATCRIRGRSAFRQGLYGSSLLSERLAVELLTQLVDEGHAGAIYKLGEALTQLSFVHWYVGEHDQELTALGLALVQFKRATKLDGEGAAEAALQCSVTRLGIAHAHRDLGQPEDKLAMLAGLAEQDVLTLDSYDGDERYRTYKESAKEVRELLRISNCAEGMAKPPRN